MPDAPVRARRPLADRIEVAAPSLAAVLTRAVGRLPAPSRRCVLSYVIRQVTELRGGRVVSQVNEQIG